MDDSSIAGRTEELRREIELIQREERRHRNNRSHSLAENAEHQKRKFRVLAIREELRTLVEKSKATIKPRISLVQLTFFFQKESSFDFNRSAPGWRMQRSHIDSDLG